MKAKFLTSTLLVGLLLLAGCSGGASNNGGNDDDLLTVNFRNWNDQLLYTDHVEFGGTAEYKGDTPTKPNDESFKYTFDGWDKDLTNVSMDFDTKATFLKTPLTVDDKYDESADKWSEKGHLYFHYKRPKAASPEEYNDWAIWLWNKAPDDSEGTLWGGSLPSVKEKFTCMSNGWVDSIGGTGKKEDQAGRVMDIDLNKDGLLSGKTAQPVNLIGADVLGFLVVKQDSMDGGTHWTSDGGANTYIRGFQEQLAKKGYVHIYVTQGNVGDFTFSYSSEVKENPVVTDTTGDYRSTGGVNSSKSPYGVSKTSESFKELGVGYQIFVGSFRDSNGDGLGDIRGIIDALPYLKDLGVEVLWLTPIQESESYHGYDITDFYKIDPKFGTEEDYRELLYKCHESGMKVLMDFVVNHTSKNNVWFKKSQRAEIGHDEFGNEIKYRDMYHWKFEGDMVNWFNPKTEKYEQIPVEQHKDWYRDGESKYFYYGKFGSNMAELNYDCQATRDLVTSMALYWLGFGVDGFRLDAVKHIYMKDEVPTTGNDTVITDTGLKKPFWDEEKGEIVDDPELLAFDYSSDLTKNVVFWKEFANKLKNVYPNCFLVGENYDGWGDRIAPYYQALDSQFDFALFFHSASHVYALPNFGAMTLGNKHFEETYDRYASMNNKALGDTGLTLEGGKRPDFINGAFTSNHDTARMINNMNGTPVKNAQGHIVDSLAAEAVSGTPLEISKAKVGAAITILNPGISWIYYGDELGMSGNTDKHIETYENENNKDLWFRQPFKWDQEGATTSPRFDKYKIQWDEHNKTILGAETQETNEAKDDMFDFFKELINVKKTLLKGTHHIRPVFNPDDDAAKDDLVTFFLKNEAGETLKVYINSGAKRNKTFNISGTILAALNGAETNGALPPYGVIVSK